MNVQKVVTPRVTPLHPHYFSDTLHPLLKRIYLNRHITHEDDIKTDLSELLSFKNLLNIDQAAIFLADGLLHQKQFLIIGDFDTDGATSTALAVKALTAFGAQYVDYLIPNRFEYGYGLTPEIVDAAKKYSPDIIITVDNGISSHEGVRHAKQLGIKVLITDHHLPAETLPEADVIINPNQQGDMFASKNLAGVGVIFYVMLALRNYLKTRYPDHKSYQINMAQFLDLVALGTVADVVPLDKNNRILVYQGMKRIKHDRVSCGIEALLAISNKCPSKINASDLGFAVAPRLNAAGRLEDMSVGVACLLTDDKTKAAMLAAQLDQLNCDRREIERSMTIQGDALLAQLFETKQLGHLTGICLYHPDFHQGVIGILAGRIKDRYYRPAVVFSKVSEGVLKGSARSISHLHLRDLLALMDVRHPGLILKFGGHAMAAGLSISEQNITLFSNLFDQYVKESIASECLDNILYTDGTLCSDDFCTDTAEMLYTKTPWGQAFPEPLFEGEFELLNQKLIQDKHLKLMVRPCSDNDENKADLQLNSLSGCDLDAIYFNYEKLITEKKIYMAYRLSINEYKGNKKIQLMIDYIK